jgi:uncharacterized radical SAM superfamily Fe-S cluster-containing enzyme
MKLKIIKEKETEYLKKKLCDMGIGDLFYYDGELYRKLKDKYETYSCNVENIRTGERNNWDWTGCYVMAEATLSHRKLML